MIEDVRVHPHRSIATSLIVCEMIMPILVGAMNHTSGDVPPLKPLIVMCLDRISLQSLSTHFLIR